MLAATGRECRAVVRTWMSGGQTRRTRRMNPSPRISKSTCRVATRLNLSTISTTSGQSHFARSRLVVDGLPESRSGVVANVERVLGQRLRVTTPLTASLVCASLEASMVASAICRSRPRPGAIDPTASTPPVSNFLRQRCTVAGFVRNSRAISSLATPAAASNSADACVTVRYGSDGARSVFQGAPLRRGHPQPSSRRFRHPRRTEHATRFASALHVAPVWAWACRLPISFVSSRSRIPRPCRHVDTARESCGDDATRRGPAVMAGPRSVPVNGGLERLQRCWVVPAVAARLSGAFDRAHERGEAELVEGTDDVRVVRCAGS